MRTEEDRWIPLVETEGSNLKCLDLTKCTLPTWDNRGEDYWTGAFLQNASILSTFNIRTNKEGFNIQCIEITTY